MLECLKLVLKVLAECSLNSVSPIKISITLVVLIFTTNPPHNNVKTNLESDVEVQFFPL